MGLATLSDAIVEIVDVHCFKKGKKLFFASNNTQHNDTQLNDT